MAEDTPNLAIELLQTMRDEVREICAEQREQRTRLASLERSVGRVEQELGEQRAGFNARFDRVNDRIERRLDLVDVVAK